MTQKSLDKPKQSWEKFLKDMGWDEPKDGWTLEKQRVKQLLSQTKSQIVEQILEIQEKYNELIMAVGNKYEGETRHETALRYIKSAEMESGVSIPMSTINSVYKLKKKY